MLRGLAVAQRQGLHPPAVHDFYLLPRYLQSPLSAFPKRRNWNSSVSSPFARFLPRFRSLPSRRPLDLLISIPILRGSALLLRNGVSRTPFPPIQRTTRKPVYAHSRITPQHRYVSTRRPVPTLLYSHLLLMASLLYRKEASPFPLSRYIFIRLATFPSGLYDVPREPSAMLLPLLFLPPFFVLGLSRCTVGTYDGARN